MSSAVKSIAAGVIVALFGGFVLMGVLTTQQGNDMAPAAVTVPPSPTDELPSTMATEEVEPGVYRVTSDGVRDLASVEAVDIVAGYDGGIWLLRADEFLRLGSDGSHEWPASIAAGDHVLEVAPDGTMWAIPTPEGAGLYSTDGKEWTVQPCPAGSTACQAFTVAPDGTVWASWTVGAPHLDGVWRVSHLGPTGWQALDGDVGVFGGIQWWFDRFFFTDNGDLYGGVCDWACWLHRYDDGIWEEQATARQLVDVGPDGTVWTDDASDEGLARLAGGEWERWTSSDLADIRFNTSGGLDYEFKVAPGGSLWFSPWRSMDGSGQGLDLDSWECDGLARFDGETLDRFLPGRCVVMDIAADGSVWVLAADETALLPKEGFIPDDHTWDLYVITPEAVAASEEEVIEPLSVEETNDAEEASSTTADLLSTMVTEEVEPGVIRVVNDGVRDLSKANSSQIVAGHDDGIWLLRPKRFFRLGSDEWHGWATGKPERVADFEVAPDGTVWTVQTASEDTSAIHSFDGKDWTTHHPAAGWMTVEVTPNGRTWAVWSGDGEAPEEEVLGSFDADGWQALGTVVEPLELLVAGPDDIWATIGSEGGPWGLIYLHRYLDGSWQRLLSTEEPQGTWQQAEEPIVVSGEHAEFFLADIGVDGTLWGVEVHGPEPASHDLVRFDGDVWGRWPLGGIERGPYREGGTISVAPDASIWLGLWTEIEEPDTRVWGRRCAGVAHFDGARWQHYLTDFCVGSVDTAADGSAWVLAAEVMGTGTYDVYVIPPEAVAASE